jgi:hypothetical protein
MKRKVIIAVLVLAILAFFSNPSKEQYVSWAKNEAIKENGKGLAGALTSIVAPTIIDGTTQADNYIFLTIFRTKIARKEVFVLGAFNSFIRISGNQTNATAGNQKTK